MRGEKKRTNGQIVYTAFLQALIKQSGVTIKELSERIGITTTSMQHWFRSDDVNLKRVLQVSQELGYRFLICLNPRTGAKEKEPVFFSPSELTQFDIKRLHFLAKAMKDRHITKKAMAESIGIRREAVTYWFTYDDITMRNLVTCAQLLDMDILIRFERNVSVADESRTGIKIQSSVSDTLSWLVEEEQA